MWRIILKKVYDGIIGLAIGAALGVPVECKSRQEIAMERKDVIVEKIIDGKKEWSYQSLKKKYYTHERKNIFYLFYMPTKFVIEYKFYYKIKDPLHILANFNARGYKK